MNSSCRGLVIPIVSIVVTLAFLYVFRYPFFYYFGADEDYPSYKHCAPSMCGNSTIRYPFGKCGHGSTHCLDNQTIQINLCDLLPSRVQYCGVIGNITKLSYSTRTLQIAQNPYMGNSSVQNPYMGDYSVQYYWYSYESFFNLSQGYMVGSVLNCTQESLHIINETLTRLDWGETDRPCFFYPGFLIDTVPAGCTPYSLIVPRDKKYNISGDKNFQLLNQRGFQITWDINRFSCPACTATGGRCYFGSYGASESFLYLGEREKGDLCICHHGVYRHNCSEGHHTVGYSLSVGVTAGIFFGACALFSIVVVSCIVVRRQFCCTTTAIEEQSIRAFMDPVDSRTPSVESFLNYYSSQMPARYSYAQIMTYTNNLVEKLGKGGFGTVYKGQLPTGHGIAVKILDGSKQSEQQFIAEVATVGTTCHVNLVRLLGYCSQGSIRALVYEYMVNGSLDKYIHRGRHNDLDWEQLYSIALGTARGIAYLHDDCRNRIIHFDIKPHNVLLDAAFLPKVADFGLAEISNREQSHISVGNRGTLGYAAPELWSGMYGAVTDKCDVYSYGMLLMEMVGARQNIDFDNEESSSKFCYAEWAFKQVEKGHFENLRKENMSEEEQGIAKKLSLVGLWCIQFNASHRPQMSKVIHMLEGDSDIATPPSPFPVDPPMAPMQLSSCDLSSSTITTPFPFPFFSHPQITAMQPFASDPSSSAIQPFASDPSSSTTYALEVQMNNPNSTHSA